jgi:hypothetical protein
MAALKKRLSQPEVEVAPEKKPVPAKVPRRIAAQAATKPPQKRA